MEDEQVKQTGLVEWEAEEFQSYKRGFSWYLIWGGAILLATGYFIYTRNWFLAGVVVMLGVVLYLSGRIRPKMVGCVVDNSGINIGDRKLSYNQLKIFWFTKSEGSAKLNLISTFKFMPVISLKIDTNIEDKLRKILSQFLPESKDRGEDWTDQVGRFLKL